MIKTCYSIQKIIYSCKLLQYLVQNCCKQQDFLETGAKLSPSPCHLLHSNLSECSLLRLLMSFKATATENATSDIEEMKCVDFGRSVSACELSFKPAEGCVNLCGMCPSCVFAPAPPGSVQCLWRASDEFKRRFVTELLLRCRNTGVIESIQSVLGVKSWTLYTYARSRSPTSLQDYTRSSSSSARVGLDGRPLGLDMRGIWGWFNSSPDWVKTRYLCRLFSLCDSELLRMVANLTSVLLVRQKRGFLQFNGKKTTTQSV